MYIHGIIIVCLFFVCACTTVPATVSVPVAVPVEKLVFVPLDPALFQPCDSVPLLVPYSSTWGEALQRSLKQDAIIDCLNSRLLGIRQVQPK